MLIWLLGTFIISYTLGSIPFGLLLSQVMGHGDLRKIGSGNIGATNAMRTGNKLLGILTLLFDMAKGASAVWICSHYYSIEYGALAGLFAVVGHVFPVWLRFKGGKGVATAIGVFLALHWMLAAAVCLLWLCVFALTRISSVSSLISIGYSSAAAYVIDNYITAMLCLSISAIIIVTHRGNIMRLLTGQENTFLKKA